MRADQRFPRVSRGPSPAFRRTVPVIALATVAALAGCGGAAEADAAASATCTSTTATSILLGTNDLDVSYIPYGPLAEMLGYFDEECLDVTVETQIDGQQALVSGQVDFNMSSPDTLIMAADTEQLPVEIVYNLIPRLNLQLAVAPGSGITSAADLEGARIGVLTQEAIYDNYLQTLLQEQGLSLDDVTEVATGYGATSMESLESGDVDAVLGWPGLFTSYQLTGYSLTLLDPPSWESDYDGIGLAARTDFVEEHPDVVEKVSRALAKAEVYLQKYPESAVRLYWEAYPEHAPMPGDDEDAALADDLAILTATMDSMGVTSLPADHEWGVQTLERWQAQIAYDTAGGLLGRDVDASTFFTADHITAANDFDRDAITEVG